MTKQKMKKLRFETHRYAVVSTAHITQKDGDLLAGSPGLPYLIGPIVDSHAYGWMVWVPQAGTSAPSQKRFLQKYLAECREVGMSEAFCDLILACHLQGFSHLRLDQDGPQIEGLPVFDW